MPHNIELFQVLTVLLCLGMIAKAASQFRRGRRTGRELVAWIVIWGVIAFVGIYPAITDHAAHILGLKSGSTTFIFFLLIVLIYLTLRSMFEIELLEGKISELTRKLAIKEFENGRKGTDAG